MRRRSVLPLTTAAMLGVAGVAAVATVAGVAAATGGEGETTGQTERGQRDELVLANVHCESFRGRSGPAS